MTLAFRRTVLLTIVALVGLGAGGALAQDKPRYGGILNWFDYGDPGRLDVHAESPLVVQQATAGIWSGLLHYDPDDPSKIAGDLAERWTVSPDGRTYTFHLRRGVKWHDGQPFGAADVKATFDRLLNPDFKGPKCGAALKPMVAGVEVLDPATVQFRLKTGRRPRSAPGRSGSSATSGATWSNGRRTRTTSSRACRTWTASASTS
jgi:peptide/nickel transport system substrate-binding protein